MGIHALRYYPEKEPADEIVRQLIAKKNENNFTKKHYAQFDLYQKTSVDFVANKYSLQEQINNSIARRDMLFRFVIYPYNSWLKYATPFKESENNLALTSLFYEDYKTIYQDNKLNKKGSDWHASRNVGLFETIGRRNLAYFIDEMMGDIDLYRDKNEAMSFRFKSPLAQNAMDTYDYFLAGQKEIDGTPCFEIAFYSKNLHENALAGYLYVSTDGSYSLLKAVFTLNNTPEMNFVNNILFVHTFEKQDDVLVPVRKEYSIMVGDDIEGNVLVNRIAFYRSFDFEKSADKKAWRNKHDKGYTSKDSISWSHLRPEPLTASQLQVGNLVQEAEQTKFYKRSQNLFSALFYNYVDIGGVGGNLELGPLTQLTSYNKMEGLRLKLSGNTTMNLNSHLMVGGYVAYGLKDERLKYRGDIAYSFIPKDRFIWEYPKRLLSFTYVNDLNIPGQDLLISNRDNLFYSLVHASANNMSLQRIGLVSFENEMPHQFSFKLSGKYTYDRPMGVIHYMKVQGADTSFVRDITSSEVGLSLRYSPREKFIQRRNDRFYIRRGDIELNLNHRVGIKGLFDGDYNYQITDFKAYKQLYLPQDIGAVDITLSAGKVWNRVPFPLLFIPTGNQSYVFEPDDYNCMNFSEFATDNFVAGNVNFIFNWSPVKLFNKKNKIRTSVGARMIYGPLSDKNNPELHPELFVFNRGVNPLGDTPYTEVNVGLANIFKIFRIEYVRRLTYLDNDRAEGGHKITKGSLFLTGSVDF